MTKQDLQKELLENVTEGVKPSDLKKLKRSKSADDISSSTPNVPLKKSQSQLEIPVIQQPSSEEQITQLKQTLTFTQTTAQNYLQSLQLVQAKNTDLEENKIKDQQKIKQLADQVLQLRLDKIKEFGDYLENKNLLETELELNVSEGLQEIKKLENKLIATNKKKLELQQKLGQAHSKNAQLELKLINNEDSLPNSFNYWPVLLIIAGLGLTIWIFNQPE